MKKIPLSFPVPVPVFFSGISCNNINKTELLRHQTYRVSESILINGTLQQLLRPYQVQDNKMINHVIGIDDQTFLLMAAEKYYTKVDHAFVNNGDFRVTQLFAGNVTGVYG